MTNLPPYPYNLIADDLLSCTLKLRYGRFPFLGLLAFAPVPAFLFVPVLTLVLARPVLLLPRLALLALAVAVLVLVGGGTLTVTLALLTVMLALAGRLALPLFALSGVQATLETRSVNTARAKIFLIIVSFKAAASLWAAK
jgi:hypothetical protein